MIDWKKKLVIFEDGEVKFTQPLDPYHGPRYTETVDNKKDAQLLDHLYQMTERKREGYINPTMGGTISWRSVQSSELGSEIAWDDWQQVGYENNTRICANIQGVN